MKCVGGKCTALLDTSSSKSLHRTCSLAIFDKSCKSHSRVLQIPNVATPWRHACCGNISIGRNFPCSHAVAELIGHVMRVCALDELQPACLPFFCLYLCRCECNSLHVKRNFWCSIFLSGSQHVSSHIPICVYSQVRVKVTKKKQCQDVSGKVNCTSKTLVEHWNKCTYAFGKVVLYLEDPWQPLEQMCI